MGVSIEKQRFRGYHITVVKNYDFIPAVTDCLYALAAVAVSPMIVYRMVRHNRYRKGWSQRLGDIARKHPEKPCIWIHAVSVGEVNATRTIVAELEEHLPACEILITTTTDTGFARAKTLYSDRFEVAYFPLDFSFAVKKAFSRIRPCACVLLELEVWPNFVRIAFERNIPVVVINGRLSSKSYRGYRRILPLARGIFEKLTLVLAQDEQYAARFKGLGTPADRVAVTGSVKYDTAEIADSVEGADELARQLSIAGRLLVAGGTGNGEERIVLDAFEQISGQKGMEDVRLVIVPRKPERFDEVANLIAERGLPLVRYSLIKTSGQTPESQETAVILGDTMGDMRKFYSLATVIFVGRSLVPMGGSDMIEAAALGKATVFGPHTFNFTQTAEALLAANGAVLVNNAVELACAMAKLLEDPAYAAEIAAKGRQVIIDSQGATEKTVERIVKLMNSRV